MLTIDDVVKIVLTIGSVTGGASAFETGLILGSSTVIATTVRIKEYTSAAAVLADGFADSTAEYKAARAYFSNNPAPERVYIGVIGDGETPLQALEACAATGASFDSVFVCGATTAQLKALQEAIDAAKQYHLWYTATGNVAAETADSGSFATLKATGSRRCIGLYSTDAAAGAGAMGALLGKLHAYPNGAVQACYSELGGVEVSDLTAANVEAILGAGGNVYISRSGSRGLLENGQTAEGLRIDDAIYLDMLARDLQTACFNLMAEHGTRLPQTDETSTLFLNAVAGVMERYAARNIIATGRWTGGSVGNVATGDTLENGYALYVDSYDNQSVADRNAHKAMPITVCLILAGSVESVEIDLYAQR